MKENVQTKIFNTPLRFALSTRALSRPHTDSVEATRDYMNARKKERNTIHINTKSPRPVFEERENPDTPPAITDHVRELATLIRNMNSLTDHEPRDFLKLDAIINQPYEIKPRYRPLWVCSAAPVKGKYNYGRIYTVYSNIQHEDKPAFRHDSLHLFNILSEDYTA